MTDSYEKTLAILGKSRNRAASRILEAAMRSSHPGIKTLACKEALHNWSSRKLVHLLRGYDKMDETELAVLRESPSRLSGALRVGMLSNDPVLQRNSVRAALQLQVTELIPLLLIAMQDSQTLSASEVPIPEVTYRLVQLLLVEMQEDNGSKKHRHDILLRDIAEVVSRCVNRPLRNDTPVFLKVLLYLFPYLTKFLPQLGDLFTNPNHSAYRLLLKLLNEETDPSIIHFVIDALNSPNAPGMTIAAISKRTDFRFIRALLVKITETPSPEMRSNLSRIHRFEWTPQVRALAAQLDAHQQACLVALVANSSIPSEDAFAILSHLVTHGKTEARQAAITELATHPGAEGDELVMQASEDDDPNIQAAAVRQLRARNSPKAMMRLIELAASPHPVVQEAVRKMLPELRIDRFLSTLDQMSEEQQKLSFRLVRRIDPRTNEYLKRELLYSTVANKVRALHCLEMDDLVPQFEEPLSTLLLEAEDVAIRVQAARLLASGQREISRNSLLQSMHHDTSLDVRVTAKASLQHRMQRTV